MQSYLWMCWTPLLNGLTAFLDDTYGIYDKYEGETESSLWVTLESADASEWIQIVMPRVKFNGADIDPPQSGAVPVPTPYEALESTLNGRRYGLDHPTEQRLSSLEGGASSSFCVAPRTVGKRAFGKGGW